MNNLTLIVVEQTSKGSYHLKIIIDEKESGILYLTQEQYEAFIDITRLGCREKGISFILENPFDDSYDDELDEE